MSVVHSVVAMYSLVEVVNRLLLAVLLVTN